MRPQSLLLVGLAAVLAGLAFLFLRGGPDLEDPGSVGVDAERIERGGAVPDTGVELAETGDDTEARHVATTGTTSPTAAPTVEFEEGEHPWSGQLAGLVGRIVEVDGTPIAGLKVELLEADIQSILQPEHTPLGIEGLVVSEARTGEDGRFQLGEARGSGFHGLSIDAGGARSTIRVIEQALTFGEVTDVGDIVLDAYGVVVGTVVDEDGEPVAGARVRMAVVPDVVVQSGILDLREGSIVAGGDRERFFVVDLPAWVTKLSERLPAPTAFTDAEGAFRLEGVPIGRCVGGVDKAGYVATVMDPLVVAEGGGDGEDGAYDVGELELIYGRTVTGRALDRLGKPVAGVEVRAGALHAALKVGFLQDGVVTGDDGTFEIPGVPEDGNVIGIARREARDPWVQVAALPGLETLEFEFPATAPLQLLVRDEAGTPLSGADVKISPAPEMDGFGMEMVILGMTRREVPPSRVTSSEPGVYVVEDVPLGRWNVEVAVAGRAKVQETIDHDERLEPEEIVCPTGTTIRVRVTDAATGEPVSRAHVAVLGSSGFLFEALASGWSDEAGVVALGPVPPPVEQDDDLFGRGPFEGLGVLAEHPGYGPTRLEVGASDIAGEIVIALEPPGSLSGRVTWGGEAPPERYMLALVRDGRGIDEMEAPRTTITNEAGEFRFSKVGAGKYRINLLPRFLDGNPLGLFALDDEPDEVYRAEVTIEAGAELIHDIGLRDDGTAAPGWFEGRVVVDGQPIAGAVVKVHNNDEYPEVLTDGNGEFKTGEIAARHGYHVTIKAELMGDSGELEQQELYGEWTRVSSGRGTRIDVDMTIANVTVEVIDAVSRKGIEGVDLNSLGIHQNTDAEGRATFRIRAVGEGATIWTNAQGYRSNTREVELDEILAGATITIELEKSIPCAGTVVLPPSIDLDDSPWLLISKPDAPQFSGEWVNIDPEKLTFSVDDLSAGELRALLWTGNDQHVVRFELPPGGDEGIVLDFTNPD